MQWKPYDPTWLIALAKAQYPQEAWLHQAFAVCTRCLKRSKAYYYFIPADKPNQPGSPWQISHNMRLEDPQEGTIIVDILVGNRVGGIEFLDRL